MHGEQSRHARTRDSRKRIETLFLTPELIQQSLLSPCDQVAAVASYS